MVEIDEKTPVGEPSAAVQLDEGGFLGGGCGCPSIYNITQRDELFGGRFEFSTQDIGGEFSPVGRHSELGVGGEDPVMIEVL